MPISPEQLTRALADQTRLRILSLLSVREELCVCNFTDVLAMPQPKISRHLGILREASILLDRRDGQWIHYRLHPDLPLWAVQAIAAVVRGCMGKQPYAQDQAQLPLPAAKAVRVCA
jgi:ArsR family transcriptional regulator